MDTYLTVNEVAERLRVSPGTVRRQINLGRLRAVRIGRVFRIRSEEMERYVSHDADTSAPIEAPHHIDDVKPLTFDSEFWKLVGAFSSDEPTNIARDKDEMIAESVLPRAPRRGHD